MASLILAAQDATFALFRVGGDAPAELEVHFVHVSHQLPQVVDVLEHFAVVLIDAHTEFALFD